MKLYFYLSSLKPLFFALNENDLEAHMNHLYKKGCNRYDYEQEKQRGFIQMIEIVDRVWEKINAQKDFCIYWDTDKNHIKGCQIKIIEDNSKTYAKNLNKYWNCNMSLNKILQLGNHKINIHYNEENNIYELM